MTPFPCQYLVFYGPDQGVVPVSVFFVIGNQGVVRGLYFGDAGSGTFDEAYFRMDADANGEARFLECDNPEDATFVRDRAKHARRPKAVALSPDDAGVFEELRAYRQTWWTFEDGDAVSLRPGRLGAMQEVVAQADDGARGQPWRFARSTPFDQAVFERVRAHWSLRGL